MDTLTNLIEIVLEQSHMAYDKDEIPIGAVIFDPKSNKLIAKANKTSEFLFIAGKPIGEPIARGGPFVMNTKTEVLEAVQDYNNGTFAKY